MQALLRSRQGSPGTNQWLWSSGQNPSAPLFLHYLSLSPSPSWYCCCILKMPGYLQLLGDCVNDLGVWIGSIHPTVPLLRVLHLYVDLAQLLLQTRVLVDLEQKSQRENEVKFLCRSLEILDRAAEACLGKQVALVLHIKCQMMNQMMRGMIASLIMIGQNQRWRWKCHLSVKIWRLTERACWPTSR